jgi:hypothetical protein
MTAPPPVEGPDRGHTDTNKEPNNSGAEGSPWFRVVVSAPPNPSRWRRGARAVGSRFIRWRVAHRAMWCECCPQHTIVAGEVSFDCHRDGERLFVCSACTHHQQPL